MKQRFWIIVTILVIVGGVWWLVQSNNGPTQDPSIIRASDHVFGTGKKITLIEYGDFQCPACASYASVIKQLKQEFASDATFVYRHYPLTQIHKNALSSALTSEAAGAQGKFWEMHDTLYESQKDWSELADPKEQFVAYAKKLGLNEQQFRSDMNRSDLKNAIDDDRTLGNRVGVPGTPTFVLNGERIQENPTSLEAFRALLLAHMGSTPNTKDDTSLAPHAVHEHANLLIIIDGKPFDLGKPQYQSSKKKELNEVVHLHDGNGTVVHKHRSDATWGMFFESLPKTILTRNCFAIEGKQYCSSDAALLKFYVNGNRVDDLRPLAIHDLDRVLISFGTESGEDVVKQQKTVGDNACIYSEKCPERGKAPTEDCVGGLGTGCDNKE